MVSKRSLEVRDLDETVTREEVVAAPCIALGKPDLEDQCRYHVQPRRTPGACLGSVG